MEFSSQKSSIVSWCRQQGDQELKACHPTLKKVFHSLCCSDELWKSSSSTEPNLTTSTLSPVNLECSPQHWLLWLSCSWNLGWWWVWWVCPHCLGKLAFCHKDLTENSKGFACIPNNLECFAATSCLQISCYTYCLPKTGNVLFQS